MFLFPNNCLGQEKQIEVVERELTLKEQEEEVSEEGEKVEGEEVKECEDGEKVEGEEVKEGGEGEKGEGGGRLETQESKEEEMTIIKPKMKEFPGSVAVAGLRIRAEPSFIVSFAHMEPNIQVHVQ